MAAPHFRSTMQEARRPDVVSSTTKEPSTMRRILIALLVIAAVAIGGGFIANTAYQAGLSANVTVVEATTGSGAVTPVVVPAYGWGWGPGAGPGWGGGSGFSIVGFLGTLFVIFLFIALIRALMFRGGRRGPRGGGPGGWGGPRGWDRGPGGHDHDHAGRHPWEARAHQAFDDWHRDAHAGGTDPATDTPDRSPGSPSPATQP
jgi:hypothetical protein